MKSYGDIKVGDKAELAHTITKRDIERFVELTGDDNKLHTDDDFAGTTSLKKPVAHGMLGASFISTIIGTKLPGDGALWFAQSLEFLQPVRVGDRITVRAEVLRKSDQTKTIELSTDIFNQSGQKVTAGTAKVRVIETAAPAKPAKAPARAKTALVTGATGGIGEAVSLRLAADGYDVAVHYRGNEKGAEALVAKIKAAGRKAFAISGDASKDAADIVAQAERRLGSIAVLAHCAGADIPSVKLADLSWETVAAQLDSHVKSAFLLQKAAVPAMAKARYGKIIFIGSLAAERPNAQWLHYITAKAALQGMARALALELAPSGVRVNLVSPGMTETPLIAGLPEKARLLAEASTPLQRIARPDDVAGAVSYLASPSADFLTGETIRVNGGLLMA